MRPFFQTQIVAALREWSSTSPQNRVLLGETILEFIESSSLTNPPSDMTGPYLSSQQNRHLHQQVLLWNKVLSSFPGDIDDLLSPPNGCGDLQQQLTLLSQKYSQHDRQKQDHFEFIKSHHASFVRNGWITDHSISSLNESLEKYGESAMEIGKRSWVKHSHHWIMNKLFSFFRKKGFQRELFQEYKDLNILHQRPDPHLESECHLQFLDIGSCYDPLSQLLLEMDSFGHVDITAVDLYPMSPQVYPCDLLQVEITSEATRPYSTQEQKRLGLGSPERILSLPPRSYHAVSLALVLSYLPTPALRYQMLQKACELLFQPSSISSESSTDQSKRYGTLIIVDTYRSITKKNWISKDDHVDLEDDASTDKCPSNLQNASRLIRWLPIMESIGFKLLKHEVIHDHRLVQNRISSRKKTKKASIGLFFRTMTLEEMEHRSQRSMTRKFHTFSSPKRPFSASSSNPPHLPIGIIGAGIGGSALAFILHQQGIPYLLFDRDEGLSSRPQGYAVTIQQGISVLRSIGIITSVVENKYNRNVSNVVDHAHVTNGLATRYPIIIPHCTISRSHVSFDQEGKLLGVFGPPAVPSPLPPHLSYPSGFLEFSRDSHTLPPTDQPKMESSTQHSKNTRQNIHMPRQALRDTLLTHSNLKEIKWGHKFEDCDLVNSLTENTNHLKLRFHNHPNEYSVSGLVGCDGIYSNVRKLLYKKFLNQGDWSQAIQKPTNPESFHERNLCNQLNYLGLFVILGISPRVDDGDRSMTRRKVQWVDGVTRVFSMPYDDQHDMWQMSFPMTTQQILQFHPQTSASSSQRDSHRNYFSSEKLKELALTQCHSWHTTLTAMLERTEASLISGHPVYDQHPTDLTELKKEAKISHLPLTLLGDSWHPMSPFKAQGANQALLDALSLSKQISQWWRERRSPLGPFFGAYESEAYDRSAKKVLKSRLAAQYLHSPVVMTPGNVTRASVAEKASQ